MPPQAAVAHADVVEHRLLGRRLGFLVAGEHRENDRFREAVRVAGVQRRVQVDDSIELRRGTRRRRRHRDRAKRLPPRQKPDLSSPAAAWSMQLNVSRPGRSAGGRQNEFRAAQKSHP